MSLSAALRRAPLRLVTGAYILNSGLDKFRGDDETAKAIHQMASGAYPIIDKVEPKTFVRALATAEVGLGAALLLPVVPAAAAGAGLTAFSGGLLGLYWRTPSLHRHNDPRPTHEGVAIAKDSWMFGIGVGLIIDALGSAAHDRRLRLTHRVQQATAVNAAIGSHTAEALAASARSTAHEMKGKAAELTGTVTELKGKAVEMKGKAVEMKGKAAELTGTAAELRGKAIEMKGKAAEAKGKSVEVTGAVAAQAQQTAATMTARARAATGGPAVAAGTLARAARRARQLVAH